MFSASDLKFFEQKGISLERVNWQIDQFKKGVKPINLFKAATPGKGIIIIDKPNIYADIFEKSKLKITKFIPASGAASRMFKSLFEYLENQNSQSKNQPNDVTDFIAKIEKFAFYAGLNKCLTGHGGIKELVSKGKYDVIITALLNNSGLSYGKLPKGLLLFHSYDDGTSRTPFEEHLVEGALYARNYDGSVNVHFTVSPEHMGMFRELMGKTIPLYNSLFKVNIKVGFSIQKPSTDTIAVTSENKPFYDTDNSILFRPGGHGALIENLNDIDSDLIFIKNIDNVVKQNKIKLTVQYKKMLAGLLIDTQQKLFSILKRLNNKPDSKTIQVALSIIHKDLNIDGLFQSNTLSEKQLIEIIINRLNRPLRVCGVVKNQGEPGGGPYLVKNENGCISPQIVESSQIDNTDNDQLTIFNSATHFNPVDIVCSVKDYMGNKFDLATFVDEGTCFISRKSKNGRELKALELPGLWNGAMAGWNTLFVEVPVETFNPVKTVNDLLRKNHL